MLSEKQKKIIQLAIIFICTTLGILSLPTLFDHNTKASGFMGMLIGLLVSIAIFPEMLRGVFEQTSESRIERVKESQSLGFERSWTHPTRVPLLMAMGLFLLFVLIALVVTRFVNFQLTLIQTTLILTPIFFLLGLSGFLTIKRNEYIDNQGRRYRGFWAKLNGILMLLLGWGTLITLWINIFLKFINYY